jgi:hypothetical protein
MKVWLFKTNNPSFILPLSSFILPTSYLLLSSRLKEK